MKIVNLYDLLNLTYRSVTQPQNWAFSGDEFLSLNDDVREFIFHLYTLAQSKRPHEFYALLNNDPIYMEHVRILGDIAGVIWKEVSKMEFGQSGLKIAIKNTLFTEQELHSIYHLTIQLALLHVLFDARAEIDVAPTPIELPDFISDEKLAITLKDVHSELTLYFNALKRDLPTRDINERKLILLRNILIITAAITIVPLLLYGLYVYFTIGMRDITIMNVVCKDDNGISIYSEYKPDHFNINSLQELLSNKGYTNFNCAAEPSDISHKIAAYIWMYMVLSTLLGSITVGPYAAVLYFVKLLKPIIDDSTTLLSGMLTKVTQHQATRPLENAQASYLALPKNVPPAIKALMAPKPEDAELQKIKIA